MRHALAAALAAALLAACGPTSRRTAAPTLSDVRIESIGRSGATISWTTDLPAIAHLQYGTSRNYDILHI
jgi:hypothetical protein